MAYEVITTPSGKKKLINTDWSAEVVAFAESLEAENAELYWKHIDAIDVLYKTTSAGTTVTSMDLDSETFILTLTKSDNTTVTADLTALANYADNAADAALVTANAYTGETMGAHVSASDPHTQYQKESEKNQANGYMGVTVSGRPGIMPTATEVGADPAGSATTAENNAKSYADGLVVGLWDDRGNYNASGNTFPASGGSGSAGTIKKGDIWTVSIAGTLGGSAVEVGDTVRALTDTPGQTAGNWAIAQNNIGYVAENRTNKVTNLDSPNNTDYPTTQAVAADTPTRARAALSAGTGISYDTITGIISAMGGGSSITLANTAFVETSGSSDGELGNPGAPFSNLDEALAAVPVGGLVQVGIGDFTAPSSLSWKANVTVNGTKQPVPNWVIKETAYGTFTTTVPTKLQGGSIIKGSIHILDQSGITIYNLGVDCGSDYVTGGGTEGDCITITSATTTPPFIKITGIEIDKVTCLGKDPASPYHGILLENVYNYRVTGNTTIFNVHGLALKGENGYAGNNIHVGHSYDGVILRANDYATCKSVIVENATIYTPNWVDSSGNPIGTVKGSGIAFNVEVTGTNTTLSSITVIGGLFENLTTGIFDSANNPILDIKVIGATITNCANGVDIQNTVFPSFDSLTVSNNSGIGIILGSKDSATVIGKAKITNSYIYGNAYGLNIGNTGTSDKIFLGQNVITANAIGVNLNSSTRIYGAANNIENNTTDIQNGILNIWP